MTVTVIIVPKNLVTNILLSLFFFQKSPNQKSIFQQVGGLVTKSVYVFFLITSRTFLHRYAKFKIILEIKFFPCPMLILLTS